MLLKKLISILLTATLIFSSSALVLAEENQTGDKIQQELTAKSPDWKQGHAAKYIDKSVIQEKDKYHKDNKDIMYAGSQGSTNWSGVVSYVPNCNKVSGYFTVPTVSSSQKPAADGIWVGIGGTPNSSNIFSLIQAGVGAEVDTNNNKTYYPWWEVVSNKSGTTSLPPQPISGVRCNPGDQFYVEINYVDTQIQTTKNVYFYVKNVTTQQYFAYNYTMTNTVASDFNGSTEWISELPEGTAIYLPNFGTQLFNECKQGTYGGSMSPVSNTSGYTWFYHMRNQQNTYDLATPNAVNANGDFTITWKNAI